MWQLMQLHLEECATCSSVCDVAGTDSAMSSATDCHSLCRYKLHWCIRATLETATTVQASLTSASHTFRAAQRAAVVTHAGLACWRLEPWTCKVPLPQSLRHHVNRRVLCLVSCVLCLGVCAARIANDCGAFAQRAFQDGQQTKNRPAGTCDTWKSAHLCLPKLAAAQSLTPPLLVRCTQMKSMTGRAE